MNDPVLPRSAVQRWKQQEEPTGLGARVCRGEDTSWWAWEVEYYLGSPVGEW